MISSSLVILKQIVVSEKLETVGDVITYFKSKHCSITEDFLGATFILVHDGYLKGDL